MKKFDAIIAVQHQCWCEKMMRNLQLNSTKFWITTDEKSAQQIKSNLEQTGKLPEHFMILDGVVKVNVLSAPYEDLPKIWKESLEKASILDYILDKIYEDRARINDDGTPAKPINVHFASLMFRNIPNFSHENIEIMSLYHENDHDIVQFAKNFTEKCPKHEEELSK